MKKIITKYLNIFSAPNKRIIIGLSASFIGVVGFIAIYFLRQSQFIEVEIMVSDSNALSQTASPPFWHQEKIKPGAEEKNSFGQTEAKILDIKSFEGGNEFRDVYIKAQIRAKYNKRSKKYTFRGQPVLIGSPIVINADQSLIKGIITNVSGLQIQLHDVVVKVRLSDWNYPHKTAIGSDPVYTDFIDIGDKIYDIGGNIIAQVLDKQTFPGKRITSDNYGRTYLVQDPYFKDIHLTLKLKVLESNGNYYYMNKYKIKINETFPLFFPELNQLCKIIEIIDKPSIQ